MSLPKYPEYKDSAVEWMGKVPSTWRMAPLKHCFAIFGGATPKTDEAAYWEGGIVWVSPADLSKLSSIYIGDSSRKISKAGLESCSATLVPKGSIVLSTRAPIGSLAIAATELCTNQGCKSLVPRQDISHFFYAYFLQASNEALNLRGKGTTFLELSADELGTFKVPRPSIEEQNGIAKFLDRETAKINDLISEQEKLITLLAEKRQATISHAVTKGLNPDAPMKDSGVEWLGAVPEHWGHSKKLVDLAASHRHSFVNGPFGSDLLTSELVSDGVPVVYIRDIKPNGYLRVSEWCVTQKKAQQLEFCNLLPGDIIVAKVGDPPGLAAVYPVGEPEAIVTQDVIRLRIDDEIANAEYVKWLLNSKCGQTQIDSISVEATRTRVGLGDYKQLRFFVPPLLEQCEIAKFLNQECIRLDALSNEATRGIQLLNERRRALIVAAVSGKIDVRQAAQQDQTILEAA